MFYHVYCVSFAHVCLILLSSDGSLRLWRLASRPQQIMHVQVANEVSGARAMGGA